MTPNLAAMLPGLKRLATALEPELIAQEACQLVSQHLAVEVVSLEIRDGSGSAIKSGPPELASLLSHCQQEGRPLRYNGTGPACPGLSLSATMAVPLLDEGELVGALAVGSSQAAFAEEDLQALEALTALIGMAFRDARLRWLVVQGRNELDRAQAQLVQSTKMAAVGHLAGGIAHELRTPLASIALAIGGAQKFLRAHPERAEKRLLLAETSLDKMEDILSKLLLYSRDAGNDRRPTDLNQVVRETVAMLGHQIQLDNIRLAVKLAQLPLTLANHNQLQQVLINLLINARDSVLAEGATERRIEICTSCQADMVVLTVEDWGAGIASEVADRLFQPFVTTKAAGEGTGLGLSVSHELIQHHRGRIVAGAGGNGRGATFTVELPVILEGQDSSG